MESLSESAAKHARRLARRPEMPSWTPILMGLLGVFFVVYLFIALVTPAPKSTASTAPATSSTIPVATTPTTPQSAGNQTLPSATTGQGAQTVPSAAVSVAQAAALGIYTTNHSSVPLASGATFPPTATAYPSAQLVSTAVVSTTATSNVFAITLNPGPPASPGNVTLNVTVVDQAGTWSYQSAG